MDFSWATITFIDIGIFSVSVIALATGWLVSKRADKRYNALQQEYGSLQQRHESLQKEHENLQKEHENLQREFSNFQSAADQRYNALQQEHGSLQQEFSNFQSAADQRYNALQQEHEALKEENATLRSAVDALTREQKALQSAHDRLSGRHDELVERVMPVFEILAREKLMEINSQN